MRKVKYTQQNFHEKLSRINDEFLKLDDIHPFDGNLHVLYNKDHYKLALGQINTARNLIGKISKESEIVEPFDGISEEDKKLVAEMKNEAMKTVVGQGGEATNDEGVLLTMSTLIDEGVMSVKNAACQRLLNQRVELKMKSKKVNDCLYRFHVAMRKPCDNKERPLCIPQVVLEAKSKQAVEKEKRSTERDLENDNGGAGVYSASLKKHYILANDEWKEDVMPEILDGHNVYDFVDS
ncbi:hypothetical protein C1H46_032882 [Malus baccata]|uniref:Uncharacterized protein n=1 Tax=Malus baccata TaxID=106549 RepID=A0A540L510_MALBA|nr:hypothetical protein C1H46_032882 [Malus baccata]